MNKPKMIRWHEPGSMADYPVGATCDSGHITGKNSSWRLFRPVLNFEKCIKCMRCFMLCPDGVIDNSAGIPEIDYDFCKGCGICANECKLGAISMQKESDFHD